ncbi:hypothetical protein EYC80_000416 [Monilinia laxa]|uniref:Uncharacterized protein n=1 Tax=Monilinia laxa TaxID=61186 RepID=A0A5N6KAN8_MONLA|nr:hypothetical protein EYC80_000416 [Monilinia laxa]
MKNLKGTLLLFITFSNIQDNLLNPIISTYSYLSDHKALHKDISKSRSLPLPIYKHTTNNNSTDSFSETTLAKHHNLQNSY